MKFIARCAFFAALAVLMTTAPSRAQSGSWSDFFKNLKSTLSKSAVGGERKRTRGSAVAAVRGKQQKDMADVNEPTLKGDSRSAKVKRDAAYDAELEAAVDLVSKGKLADGLAKFEAFKNEHPKHRAEDVDKAIAGVKAMMAESTPKE